MGGKYTVYMHVTPNMKMYVGLTSKTVNQRWGNGTGYIKNTYFYRAIVKWGWENIEHVIVAKGLTKKQACQLEIDTIKYWATTNPKHGYNIYPGGDTGALGMKHSEETKRKMSKVRTGKRASAETRKKMSGTNNYMYGKTHTEEARKKISDANKGENHPGYGKHPSEETRKKLSLAKSGNNSPMYGITPSKETCLKKSKPVHQYDLEHSFICEWDSMSNADKGTGIAIASISRCCYGEQKTAGGFIWEFKNKAGEHWT